MPNRTPRFKWKNLSSTQWRVIFFLVVVVLGAVGWLTSPTQLTLDDAAPKDNWCTKLFDATFRSLQFFSLTYDHPDLRGWRPSWWLFFAGFLAPAYLGLSIIIEVSRPIRNFLIDRTGSLFHKTQYLIIGYGLVGQGLARALKETNPDARVVALDRSVLPHDRKEARFAGIELYPADGREIESIRAAPLRMAKAKRIFVAMGNDQQSIGTAAELAAYPGKHPISVWMQLNDWSEVAGQIRTAG